MFAFYFRAPAYCTSSIWDIGIWRISEIWNAWKFVCVTVIHVYWCFVSSKRIIYTTRCNIQSNLNYGFWHVRKMWFRMRKVYTHWKCCNISKHIGNIKKKWEREKKMWEKKPTQNRILAQVLNTQTFFLPVYNSVFFGIYFSWSRHFILPFSLLVLFCSFCLLVVSPKNRKCSTLLEHSECYFSK